MRKDTLIMIVAMVVITMGVYYGLETFVRSHDDGGHGVESVAATEAEPAATETVEAEPVAEVSEPAPAADSGMEMELVEAPADTAPEMTESVEAADTMVASESDELTEIAVKAAIDEAVKAAAAAAEQAVREAMQARNEQ